MSAEPVPATTDAPPAAEVGVRIRAHPGLCLGYGLCHRFAPAVYPLGEDGHLAVHLLEVPAEHAYEAWIGASVCPERAISVDGRPEAYWRERRQHLAGA